MPYYFPVVADFTYKPGIDFSELDGIGINRSATIIMYY